MAFVAGPRQVGKTTFAKQMLASRTGAYFNWDEPRFRRQWTRDPLTLVPSTASDIPLLVLDEIHKGKNWKSLLKGVFDTLTTACDIIVTGSAVFDGKAATQNARDLLDAVRKMHAR